MTSTEEPTHLTIPSSNGQLAVDIYGPKDGRLIICSPGLGDTRDAYTPLALHLSAPAAGGYRVATVDLRGHGDSSVNFTSYGDEETADDLLAVAEALSPSSEDGGARKKLVLAGESMSAGASTIAAGRRPDLVAGIILLGPFLRNGIGYWGRWAFHIALQWPWGPYLWQLYASSLWPGLGPEKAKQRAERSTTLLTRPGGYWTAFHKSSGADHSVVEPWLKKVRAKVLVVIGEKDPDWPEPVKEAEWVASNFEGAEILTVEGAGHAPMFEKPEIVSPAVEKWLGGIQWT